jgi:hypothetical protein
MIGYVYLDYDKFLVRKDYNYIESEYPQFFTDNRHMIVRVWTFNTEDRSNMVLMLKAFKDLEVETDKVLMFLKDIKFDIESLKKNAN